MHEVRLAHVRADGDLRLAVANPVGDWVDLAGATGDERLSTLAGALAAGEELIGAQEAVAAGTPLDRPELGPAVADPRRIFCVGRNYREHRDEFNNEETPWPETFLRLASTVIGPYDDVPKPSVSESLDYEGELAVVIGRGGQGISAAVAEEAILGYTVANDVSVRDWQRRGQQWTPGKNFDRTLPIGPQLVTRDELDWRDLRLETRLNGRTVQSASTAELIFDVPTVIEFISSWTTLLPGDLICTGTPGGVGLARDPEVFMFPGDIVEVDVEGIGALRNEIVAGNGGDPGDRWAAIAAAM